MTAHARATDPAPSKRAAASIPDDSDCIERVKRCVIGAREFNQPQIESMMATLPIGLRTNGERWSGQRVRGCMAELERAGFITLIDDTLKHSLYRYNPKWNQPEPVEAEPVKQVQRAMF